LLNAHPLTTLHVWPWLALCSEKKSDCPVTCCLGYQLTGNDPQSITRQI
jgi:hypothetical protein